MSRWQAVTLGALIALGSTAWAVGERITASRNIGAANCGACHGQAFAQWQQSPHARALAALEERDRHDPKCLQCHTNDPEELGDAQAGVQCEACHGGGRYYSPAHVMRDSELRDALGFKRPDAKTCQRCHTDATPSLKPFDFATKWALIRHGLDVASPAAAHAASQ